MKNKIFRGALASNIVLFFLCALPLSTRAETPLPEEAFLEEVHQLEILKATNPEAYRQIIREKKERLRQNFQTFREKRPGKFKKFLQHEREFKRRRLDYFRERHPEAFERFKTQRARRLDEFAQKDPQRFQRFLVEHPRFKEHYERHLLEKGEHRYGQGRLRPVRPEGFRRPEFRERRRQGL